MAFPLRGPPFVEFSAFSFRQSGDGANGDAAGGKKLPPQPSPKTAGWKENDRQDDTWSVAATPAGHGACLGGSGSYNSFGRTFDGVVTSRPEIVPDPMPIFQSSSCTLSGTYPGTSCRDVEYA
ncbi:hypothetical protein ASPBRDRAFT_30902 [Aspergillus brasiliensis CBS 101740]|uniref:Uncharacterized protein n=1 Tax=Aspergillus brasiliensis (strain CBS 101740 / IMI 381727 / IBT 21946) TaxID=767769 RepID=A0A1L9UHK4_ASPBC|nr:hypothetical protein ASPBRDRAFT_30902 [Aspergillus brasiliensis CBS 101740]